MTWEPVLPCVHIDKHWRIIIPAMVQRYFSGEFVHILIDRESERRRVGLIVRSNSQMEEKTTRCRISKEDQKRYRLNLTVAVARKLGLTSENDVGKHYDLFYTEVEQGLELLVIDFNKPC